MKPLINSAAGRYWHVYALLSISFFSTVNAQTWQPLGPDDNNLASYGGASYLSMALNSSGNPYVVFQDASVSGKATVRKFNGSFWTDVGSPGFSAASTNKHY